MIKINKKVNVIVVKIGLDIASFQADEDEDDFNVLNMKIGCRSDIPVNGCNGR